jgi:hypothetical protein
MPHKKTIPTKPAIQAKPGSKPVGVKKAVGRPRKTASKPKANRVSAGAKKAIPKAIVPSLVTAQPLSNVAPKNPEQLLYEPDSVQEVAAAGDTKKSVASSSAAVPKKRAVTPPVADSLPVLKPAVSVTSKAAPVLQAISTPPSAAKLRYRKQLRRTIMAFGGIVLIALAGWIWSATHTVDAATANADLIAAVSKQAVLPKGETPSITTVVDENKLNQEFLRNAKKGDKVLLYFQSSQAVVYRPSTGQVVNMGPLQTPRPRVFIRQGSNADNVAAVKTTIGRTSDFLLASQDESSKKDYTKTIVVDLTGNRPDLAGQLAQLLHVNVGPLPVGEIPPDADLMVIVGSDYK